MTQADGKVESREIQYKGYKTHVNLNAETGLITTVYPTLGRAADNEQFPALLAHDEAQGVGAFIYTGDQAYDDTDLHARLWELGKFSAFRLHAYRTHKQDANKEVWLELRAAPQYQAGLDERYTIVGTRAKMYKWYSAKLHKAYSPKLHTRYSPKLHTPV